MRDAFESRSLECRSNSYSPVVLNLVVIVQVGSKYFYYLPLSFFVNSGQMALSPNEVRTLGGPKIFACLFGLSAGSETHYLMTPFFAGLIDAFQ